MKKCLTCGEVFLASSVVCPSCNSKVSEYEGFVSYAPDLAHAGGGFKENYFADLAKLEENHFWFRARNSLIIWALKTYCPEPESYLEIGCGTGYVLSGIGNAFPEIELNGSEIFTAGLKFAAGRQPTAKLMQMDARNIPFFEEYDVIGAFDVLEHIYEDEQVLKQIHDALKPSGTLVLTVPQHKWLWSPADDHACHERRYSAKELHKKLHAAGFKISRTTSFVFSLLPVMYASRLIQKIIPARAADPTAELRIPFILNHVLEKIMGLEISLIRAGVNLPWGGSRLLVAKKQSGL